MFQQLGDGETGLVCRSIAIAVSNSIQMVGLDMRRKVKRTSSAAYMVG